MRKSIKDIRDEIKGVEASLDFHKKNLDRSFNSLHSLKYELDLRFEEMDSIMHNEGLLDLLMNIGADYIGDDTWEILAENYTTGENEVYLIKSEVDLMWGAQTLRVYGSDKTHQNYGHPMEFATFLMEWNVL